MWSCTNLSLLLQRFEFLQQVLHSGHTVSNIRQADKAVQQTVQRHFDLEEERKDRANNRFCPGHILFGKIYSSTASLSGKVRLYKRLCRAAS